MKTAIDIEQGALVTPREPIAFGRFRANPGQFFWVTSPAYRRAIDATISIARSGRNAANSVHLTLADFDRYFSALP